MIPLEKKLEKIKNYFSSSSNKNCLVMLSGGDDSALCLAILKQIGINVESIHFRTKWSWEITTKEAKRICKLLKVKLHIVDITSEFYDKVINKVRGRPCGTCKFIMDQKTIEFALSHGFGWICSGDNKLDGSFQRIKKYEMTYGNRDVFCGRYLDCVEHGFSLPHTLRVLRPVIDMKPTEIEKMLSQKFNIDIKRVHEVGDKYLEYWREGCPLQYADKGSLLTENLANQLVKLNFAVTEYARKRGIRASIYLPSKQVVTVPPGYEEEVRAYLIKNMLII
jgi:PP-loop superfamily ATP-utilizing enzyme